VSPREWDAVAYDRLAAPMTRWGRAVVDRLDLRGDERVLDAGCGTGKVTTMLRERLPNGEIVALDASAAMVARARERLGEDRVIYVVADLQEPLPVDTPVDAVLSTATFHWIPDHDRLFGNLASVMRPGAQLVAQCGGSGNIASVEAALRDMGESFEGRKHYAGPEDTRARLEAAGFTDAETWLQEEPTSLDRSDLEPYLATIILGDHVQGMGEDERRRFVHEVAIRLPAGTIDYVRLNITARRAAR
jgi:trans-aconitate 2-methyltransferase